ncbi:hypothetical protein BKG83_20025 [Mycobacteroides chelonae]|uniref:hypothetical protein n=1 Tax=Mycobacteroides chelonae TaxID=1774 RepID=UPI0008A9521B|nr:hypothetical protein [Mycobacteroides chelonae]OHU52131.1 hypothetical protein BKG83_20025 [Mycobacteroides chelonae]PKQ57126.1 hypothetical protein B5566_15705 [Mycobacterium sp. MHSD3]SKM63291.1 Uncharacterised protein [Mycobacteroides abscessus subsp. bolletii]
MRHRCAAVAALSLILFAAGPVATARSEPPPPEATSDPFPDVRYYDELNANDFAQPGGVWFIGPAGQNCGIWGRGSFGCSGVIPGAPAGTNHIGWIDGDRAVHYDWSMAVRFPAVEAGQPLPARSKISHQGTTCAATPDNRTYCERGPMRFAIELTRTWLSAAWTDLSWMELGPASCSPPGGGRCYR